MTGVSLAGTQLRVNEYAMHDHEWNDVKVFNNIDITQTMLLKMKFHCSTYLKI